MLRFIRLCLGAALVATCGCAPEFWNAMAESMAAQRNAYAPSTGSNASDSRETVCAKYMTADGWSKAYKVTATFESGSDLNTATGTFNYEPYSTYAVIFWDKNEASVLKLAYYFGALPPGGVEATDQRGRKWHVAEGYLCY